MRGFELLKGSKDLFFKSLELMDRGLKNWLTTSKE